MIERHPDQLMGEKVERKLPHLWPEIHSACVLVEDGSHYIEKWADDSQSGDDSQECREIL